MTHSSDAVPSNSAEEELEIKPSLISSCLLLMQHQVTLTDVSTSSTCLSVLKHISSLMATGEYFDNAVRQALQYRKVGRGSMCCRRQPAVLQ